MQNLQRAFRQTKPTQEELAVKYNITQTAISKIFKDKDKYLALDSEKTDLSRKRNDNMKQSTMDDFVTKKQFFFSLFVLDY